MENCFALGSIPQVFFEADFCISVLITLVPFSFFKEALSVKKAPISDSESQCKVMTAWHSFRHFDFLNAFQLEAHLEEVHRAQSDLDCLCVSYFMELENRAG